MKVDSVMFAMVNRLFRSYVEIEHEADIYKTSMLNSYYSGIASTLPHHVYQYSTNDTTSLLSSVCL